MLEVILRVIGCISNFQKPCASRTAGFRVEDTSRSLCYPVLCDHCLPSCQAQRQDPGLLVVATWVLLVFAYVGNRLALALDSLCNVHIQVSYFHTF